MSHRLPQHTCNFRWQCLTRNKKIVKKKNNFSLSRLIHILLIQSLTVGLCWKKQQQLRSQQPPNLSPLELRPSHKRICLCAMFPAPHFGPHPFSLPVPTFVHSPGANVIKIVAKHSNRMLCDIAMWLVLTNWLECFISACSLVLYMTSIFCQCYRHGTQNCLKLFFTTFLLNAPQFRAIL